MGFRAGQARATTRQMMETSFRDPSKTYGRQAIEGQQIKLNPRKIAVIELTVFFY
jgi:hypothetical protein